MSGQHTPGPWFVGDEDEDAGGWEYTDVHAGEDSSQTYTSVAHVQGRWDGDREMRLDETTRANARLIAAAPELLDVLDRLLNDDCPNRQHVNGHPMAAYARSIVAKATGGAA